MSLYLLQLLQLADSALPIGSAAHSFGLEMLASSDLLTPLTMELFLRDYLGETGRVEAIFCRLAYQLADRPVDAAGLDYWRALNQTLSACKPARESRSASLTLGRRFLHLVASLEPTPWLAATAALATNSGNSVHHSLAFGLAGGALALGESATVAAYLQQLLTGLLAASQRLLPLGQSQAMQIAWRLKPTLTGLLEQTQGEIAQALPSPSALLAEVSTVQPLLELASMRHATLTTRLFIS